jgi:hypothetical protein
MSLLSDLDKLSKIQDKLKKNEKNAELNHKRANLAAQMKPTDKNKNQAQKAKDVYKDINNAIDDVKDLRKDIKKGRKAETESKKLAKRFEQFLKTGKLDRAENLLGYIEKKEDVNISPFLSKNFGKIAGKSGIDFNMNFDVPQGQLLAQADLTNPQKNYFEALTNPIKFLDDVKGLVDTLNNQTRQKQQIIDDVLRPGKQNQSSSDNFGVLLAGSDFDDPSNWPSIKDADSLKEIPVKYDEEMDLLAPQIIPLETASLQGINFNPFFV